MADQASGAVRRTAGDLSAGDLPGGFPDSGRDLAANVDAWIAAWEAQVALATDPVVILALWDVLRIARRVRRVRDDLERLSCAGRVTAVKASAAPAVGGGFIRTS